MHRYFSWITILLLVVVACGSITCSVRAQEAKANSTSNKSDDNPAVTAAKLNKEASSLDVHKVPEQLPFKIGETLLYEISFSKFIFSGTVGQLKLKTSSVMGEKKSHLLEFEAEIISKGFFTWLFGVRVNGRYKSVVNAEDFGLQTSVRLLEEGKQRREQKIVIDRQAGKVTHIDRDLVTKAEPRIVESESPPWVQDLISSVYYVRAQNLAKGDKVTIPISDEGRTYNIEIVSLGKEEIKIKGRKYNTQQLEAKIFDGRYIKRSGQMIIWLSDDSRKIPLKARVKTSGTTINFEIRNKEFKK